MSRAIFIENVAKKGKLSKAEAKRTVDLVLGEIEAGLKKSKKAGRYTIGNFGTFSIVKRKGRKGRNPQTGEAIRIRASKALRFRPAAHFAGLLGRSNLLVGAAPGPHSYRSAGPLRQMRGATNFAAAGPLCLYFRVRKWNKR